MEAPIATHTMTHPTGTVGLHPTLAISPTDVTHATIPCTGAAIAPATTTTLHRNKSQEKPSHTQDLQLPINPTVQGLLSSMIPLQILPQIWTVMLIL